MTPKQADKLIKEAKTVTVRSKEHNETFTTTFIRRDRWAIYDLYADGKEGRYDRQDLEIIEIIDE